MKRLIVILAFLFAILSLCACEGSIRKNTGIKAYELGYTSDGGDGGIHADEAPVWNQEHQEFADPEAQKSITIEFGGKHYSGDYVISSYEKVSVIEMKDIETKNIDFIWEPYIT